MIPIRIRADLPADINWTITQRRINGRMRIVVYLPRDVPPDSPLEQLFVRQATRAWRRKHGRLLALPPLLAGGWLTQRLLRREIAIGAAATVAATGIVFAATQLNDHQATHRPPAAVAPHRSGTWAPSIRPAPGGPPAKPRPATPTPDTSTDTPDTGQEGRSDTVPAAVRTVRRALPGPVRRIVPPRVRPSTPVAVPPPVTSVPSPRCRLVRVEVGRLLRVCL